MKTILITGCAGFIGSHLLRELVKDYKVIGIDDLSSGSIDNLIDNVNFKFYKEPLSSCFKVFNNNEIDVVLHHAARGSVPRSIENPVDCYKNNIGATQALLEQVRVYKPRLIFSSSSSVYGNTIKVEKSEDDLLSPISPYAANKAACEHLIRAYAETYEFEHVIFRYFNVFGKRQRDIAVIPKWLKLSKSNKPIIINGDGTIERCFTHVSDIVKVNKKMVESDVTGIFNAANSMSVTLKELSEAIINITESKSDIIYKDNRKGDILKSKADITKIKNAIGFSPNREIIENLRRSM